MQARREQTAELVTAAKQGDDKAYDALVGLYQDMAVAQAVSLLGDYHLAQDAVQEAFVEGFRCLPSLRSPEAFPSWLRRIVSKHCDRMTRRRKVPTVSLDTVWDLECPVSGPAQALETRELNARITLAVAGLPEQERLPVLLLYMGRYSYREVAEFAGIPVSTVKSRLHSARLRLKGELIAMLEELYAMRPSYDEEFIGRVRESISLAVAALESGDGERPPGPDFNPFPVGHPVADVWLGTMKWAIGSGAMTFELRPADTGMVLERVHGGTVERVLSVPQALRLPLVDRFKAGAALDMSDRAVAQSGVMPVHDSRDDTLYDLEVSTDPTEAGERVRVKISRTLSAEQGPIGK